MLVHLGLQRIPSGTVLFQAGGVLGQRLWGGDSAGHTGTAPSGNAFADHRAKTLEAARAWLIAVGPRDEMC